MSVTYEGTSVIDSVRNLEFQMSLKDNKIVELKALLEMASCPQCDGGGAYYDNYGEVCQCQWCYERDEVLK